MATHRSSKRGLTPAPYPQGRFWNSAQEAPSSGRADRSRPAELEDWAIVRFWASSPRVPDSEAMTTPTIATIPTTARTRIWEIARRMGVGTCHRAQDARACQMTVPRMMARKARVERESETRKTPLSTSRATICTSRRWSATRLRTMIVTAAPIPNFHGLELVCSRGSASRNMPKPTARAARLAPSRRAPHTKTATAQGTASRLKVVTRRAQASTTKLLSASRDMM